MKISQEVADEIATKAEELLMGHVAIESVTHYVVEVINENFETTFSSTQELLEFCNERSYLECFECGQCGWYTDSVDDGFDDGIARCLSCAEYPDD